MTKLVVVNRQGEENEVEIAEGSSMMEAIRDNGFDELLALCGGCCSCATCHVYVEEDRLDELNPMSEEEGELLDSSDHRKGNSRLSCQVKVTAALEGIRVEIAPED